ncbi:MAG: hypothetical protein LBB18_02195, partial [Puniceicoccales bacterium]|nr:hypothetical protein [Puniceicoccales bacterium]
MGDRNVQSNTDNLNKQELQENKSKDLGNKFEVVSTNGGIPYSVGTDERFLKGEDPLDIRDSREETKQDVPITGKQTLGTESILKKPIGNKVFAQVSFPEQLRHTGLEGLDRKLAIQFSKDMAIGFKNEMESEYFDGTDVAAVDECIMQLKQIESYETDVADALDKIQSKRKEFARKIFDYATLKNKDISVQIPDELSQLGITDEDVDKCWDRCPGPPDLESNACISITDHLFTESRGILQGIADKVSEDGSYICLQGGWYSTTGGHNAYVIIERIGSQLYAYEINSGGGMPDKGSREETS